MATRMEDRQTSQRMQRRRKRAYLQLVLWLGVGKLTLQRRNSNRAPAKKSRDQRLRERSFYRDANEKAAEERWQRIQSSLPFQPSAAHSLPLLRRPSRYTDPSYWACALPPPPHLFTLPLSMTPPSLPPFTHLFPYIHEDWAPAPIWNPNWEDLANHYKHRKK